MTLRKFYNYLQIIFNQVEREFALITIINVDGSAYKHEGSKMLIDGEGRLFGTVSAGCLEEDLKYYAKEVIQTKSSQVILYDLRSTDDLGWGAGAGCNGAVTLLVEYVHKQNMWLTIYQELNKGNKVIQAKEIQNNQLIDTNIMVDDRFYKQNHPLNSIMREYAEEDIQTPKLIKINDRKIFFELYEPKEHLYIFGAGPDVRPLVRNLKYLDFYVHVIDPRESYNNEHELPHVDERHVLHPHVFLAQYEISPDSYVLIMTHNFEWDKRVIKKLVDKPLTYLGVLGPKHRTSRLLDSEIIPDFIHSPVGLDIGAEGEEEISISIISELIKVRNSKKMRKTVRKLTTVQ